MVGTGNSSTNACCGLDQLDELENKGNQTGFCMWNWLFLALICMLLSMFGVFVDNLCAGQNDAGLVGGFKGCSCR